MANALKDSYYIPIFDAQAAGTSDTLSSTEVDMSVAGGFDSVEFVIKFGTITAGAVTTVKVQQDTATGMGSAADLLGTAQSVAADDDDQLCVIDIHRPLEQFLRVQITRATQNSVIEAGYARLYNSRSVKPTVQSSANVVAGAGEFHNSPIEGTA